MPAPTEYCTAADLEAVIGREALLAAAADPGDDEAVDTEAVARAITVVGSLIDGWLRSRYALPLPDVPEMLRRAAVRLVHAELVGENTTTSDLIESRADAAQKLIENIAAGRIRIGGDLDADPGDQNAGTGHPRAHVFRRRPGYGRDGLRGLV